MKSSKAYPIAKLLIILASISASPCLIAGKPFVLVSKAEYLQQLDHKNAQHKNKIPKMRSFFGVKKNAPLITINSPAGKSELYSPIRIEVNFKAHDGANIQADSLKVLYGWMNLDITDRIKEYAQISHSGISAKNVELPVGKHYITIEIRDTKKRSAEKEVYFEILKP